MAGLGTGLAASFAANKLRYVIGGVVIILAAIAIVAYFHSHEKHQEYIDNQFVQKGVVQERAQTQSETINAVQEAQQVVAKPSAAQLNVVCGKYDRNCPHRP